MRTIVAIGGGEIGRKKELEDGTIKIYPVETTAIDKEIIKLSGKLNPKLLFIGTATGDNPTYIEAIQEHFGKSLDCQVDTLNLVTEELSLKIIVEKILTADIIYVGGGNTQFMQDTWAKHGVLPLLRQAYEKGTILSGLSAGANCWFEKSSTDSFMTAEDKLDFDKAKEKLAIMDNLGYLKGVCCPHYLKEPYRRPAFLHQMRKYEGIAYGIDNEAALLFQDEKLTRVLKSKPTAKAFEITSKAGQVTEKEIDL